MAYVNVADWKPDQVTDWLKGLDGCILQYINVFSNNEVNGQQLLSITYNDLEKLGIYKLGHQELILEAVEHLQNFHYELDRETLQRLALRVSCLAHSLHNELQRSHCNSHLVSTQTLADVANIIMAVKPLVCWLDRAPFSGHVEYNMLKPELLSLSLEMATSGQRDRFAEHPVEEIKKSCGILAELADYIIRDIKDPLLLQPASLDLATLKKRPSDDLGFYIVPSYHGIHQIGNLKLNSAAHQCGKIETGDEIVQINYQTVVGWQVKQVMALFEESPTEVILTIKKRPKHTKVYGQIYMKPYRLPSKKRTHRSYTRWHENIPSPRPELLTIPDFEIPLHKPSNLTKPNVESKVAEVAPSHLPSSSSEEEEEGEVMETNASPSNVRIYLPKPRIPVQRRATITGASPISKMAPLDLQQFWQELKLEREWRSGDSHDEDLDKPRTRSQLIRDCESSQLSPRKYSSFDSLKPKPDLVSSCQPENHLIFGRNIKKSTESVNDDVFRTSENSPRKKSVDSDDVFRTPESSSGMISKKSSISDDVFTTTDQVINLKTNDNNTTEKEFNDYKISLKEKIELFSKGGPTNFEFDNKIRSYSTGSSAMNFNRNMKPKVPVRTFRLSPDKNTSSMPPQVLARVINGKNENMNFYQDSDKVKSKERGRLDKSHSTPAYDFSVDVNVVQQYERNKEMMIVKLHSDNDKNGKESPRKPLGPDTETTNSEPNKSLKPNVEHEKTESTSDILETKTDTVEEVHGQMVETINQHLLKMNDESDIPELHISSSVIPTIVRVCDKKFDSNEADNSINDDNEKTEKIGKILETISSSIAVHMQKEKDNNLSTSVIDICDKNANHEAGGADLSKTISQVCQEEILQTYNPSNYSSNILSDPEVHKTSTSSSTETLNRAALPIPPRVRVTPPILPDVTITAGLSSASPVPPETPKRKPISNMEFADSQPKPVAPATFPRQQKPEPPRPLTPPEPPPRPTPPARGPCYRAILAAKSMGKSAVASPKALRKKNPLLAKMRHVSVADLGQCDYQGWLQQRCRNSGQWNTGWFVIKGTTFYGFPSKKAQKAHCLISLPGFTVSPADEVKSRKFAFKVYHTGKVFYFAANTQEEMTAWLDVFSLATLAQDAMTDSILYSESDGEVAAAEEVETESCFRSPKMKKIATFLTGAPSSPGPARSHQSLAETSKTNSETTKKFSSLKKFGNRKSSNSSASSAGGAATSSDVDNAAAGASSTNTEMNSSLDRKYLKFLNRGEIRPVPTNQFRSYRRVPPPLPRQHLHQSAESVLTLDTGDASRTGIADVNSRTRTPGSSSKPSHILPISPIYPMHLHSHHRPPDMADYRLASLSKSRWFYPGNSIQHRTEEHDTTGFITLEALMLARQEEERRQSAQMAASNHPPVRIVSSPPPPPLQMRSPSAVQDNQNIIQTTNSQDSSISTSLDNNKNNNLRSNNNSSCSNANRSASNAIPSTSRNYNANNYNNNNTYPYRNNLASTSSTFSKGNDNNHNVCSSNIMKPVRSIFSSHRSNQKNTDAEYRDGSPEKLWINSLRGNGNNNNINRKNLKKAALYQPPPVSPLDTAGGNNDDSRMQLAFEMFLDQNHPSLSDQTYNRRTPKVHNSQTPASRLKSLFTGGSSSKQDNQKTLLGSPRLHRAIFRNSTSNRSNNANIFSTDSGGESLNSPPLSPPEESSEPTTDSTQFSPASPPTPDYPGLVYPPVFEPGTYIITDVSALNANRSNQENR